MTGFAVNMADPVTRAVFTVAILRGQCRILGEGMTIRGTSRKVVQQRISDLTGSPVRSGRQLEMSIADATAWLAIHNPK